MIDSEVDELHEQGVRLCVHRPARGAGRRACRPRWPSPRRVPAANDALVLFVAFNYGGRAEIVDAVQARPSPTGSSPAELTEDDVAAHLYAPEMARARPDHPHVGRAAALELPAVGVGILGTLLLGASLARLRRGGIPAGAAGLRLARAPLRRPAERGPCLSPACWWPRIGIPLGIVVVVLGGPIYAGVVAVLTTPGSARVLHAHPSVPTQPARRLSGRPRRPGRRLLRGVGRSRGGLTTLLGVPVLLGTGRAARATIWWAGWR